LVGGTSEKRCLAACVRPERAFGDIGIGIPVRNVVIEKIETACAPVRPVTWGSVLASEQRFLKVI